jgi:hypothetical protein
MSPVGLNFRKRFKLELAVMFLCDCAFFVHICYICLYDFDLLFFCAIFLHFH